MKGKIKLVILILTLLTASAFASADVVKNSGVSIFGEDHLTYLYTPWDAFDNFDEGTGSMETDSYAASTTGDAYGYCDVWGSGSGEGNGYMKHWMTWDCPVEGIEGEIEILYTFSAWAELDVLSGGYTSAKLWLTFFVDDDQDELLLYKDHVELNGHKEYNNPSGLEIWSKTLTLEKKTYNIGVQANFKLVMDMFLGTHSFCDGGFLGNWNSQDMLVKITWPNQEPDKPEVISGEKNGYIYEQYKYKAIATDPDEDDLYYMWDWGDGSAKQWVVFPVASGEEITGLYTYLEEGTYDIRLKTKDIYGVESEWSDPYIVTMPRFKEVNNYNLIARLLERFPILRNLLSSFLLLV